jgi:alpha-tubulin suppressor-like RCC1 family protein
LSCNQYQTVVLKYDGTIVAWGKRYIFKYRDVAHNGLCTDYEFNMPRGLKDVQSVVCGGTHTIALKSNGSIIGWDNVCNSVKHLILDNVKSVWCGPTYSVILKTDGTIDIWGCIYKRFETNDSHLRFRILIYLYSLIKL